ncbi:MBL fold metallo-hydrolase [Nocardioides sp. LHG3406-4]|uniref:MBL fold metallo-hydrolase n=1 Tax=Nocardioides sp. LHG3406-4 TaxID=2804575 RepID=UPI003CE9C345
MRLTKLGHSCVRIEYDGRSLVLDPGSFTDAGATDGADAVLLTHEHPDHYLPAHLRACDAPIFTIEPVAARIREDAPDLIERVTVVAPGSGFEAAGVPVRAVGELHAVIYSDLPRVHNSGYVLTLGDRRVYHPGDAFTLPGEDVDVLCAPICAPWQKVSEAIDFALAVGAPRNLAIHDRVYSPVGLGILDTHLGRFLGDAGQQYARPGDGRDLDLGSP